MIIIIFSLTLLIKSFGKLPAFLINRLLSIERINPFRQMELYQQNNDKSEKSDMVHKGSGNSNTFRSK